MKNVSSLVIGLALLSISSNSLGAPAIHEFSHEFGIHTYRGSGGLPTRKSHQTKKEAEIRASQVENVRYRLSFEFDGSDKFLGEANIRFDLKKGADFSKQELFLELAVDQAPIVVVNAQIVMTEYKDDRIWIDHRLLKPRNNRVYVSYMGSTRTDGFGFTDTFRIQNRRIRPRSAFICTPSSSRIWRAWYFRALTSRISRRPLKPRWRPLIIGGRHNDDA